MNATKQIWMIYFVGFDDSSDSEEGRVSPYVGKKCIDASVEPEQCLADIELAALLRGGQVLAVCDGNEQHAEHVRDAVEARVLRRR
ncbi:MAG: hypothetical protein ACREJC_07830 [Tepidisphaeraceae bacterium]